MPGGEKDLSREKAARDKYINIHIRHHTNTHRHIHSSTTAFKHRNTLTKVNIKRQDKEKELTKGLKLRKVVVREDSLENKDYNNKRKVKSRLQVINRLLIRKTSTILYSNK